MKKLFSTLGMMALVSLCLFSSCKDEDYPATETQTNATANPVQVAAAETAAATNAAQEVAAALAAPGVTVAPQPDGSIKATNDADGSYSVTTVETSYTYEVNGVSYDSMNAAMAALSKLPAGSTATIVAVLHQTTTTQKYNADGTKNGEATTAPEKTAKGKETKVEIPEAGQAAEKVVVEVPTSVTDTTKTKSVDVTVTTTEKGQHSGGGIK